MNVSISISASPPAPGLTKPSSVEVLEKVREFCEDIEDGLDDTDHQWRYLKALFLRLHRKDQSSLSPIEKELMSFLEPFVMKFAQNDRELAPLIEGSALYQSRT